MRLFPVPPGAAAWSGDGDSGYAPRIGDALLVILVILTVSWSLANQAARPATCKPSTVVLLRKLKPTSSPALAMAPSVPAATMKHRARLSLQDPD